jgi:protocatechuate 3,4-dioxygenase beta subunit
MTHPTLPILPRRGLFGLAGAAMASPAFAQQGAAPGPRAANDACRLTPQAVEGPFYFDPRLERTAITDGKPGVKLDLRLRVIDGATCEPLPGARVDVWHGDALGAYSGYPGQSDTGGVSTEGQSFLRGTQFADEAGQVGFSTIYPGWYRGRTPHVHFKIFLDSRTVLTGQFYFPDALSQFVYDNASPYRERGRRRDTTNATDGILRASGGGPGVFCDIREASDRYVGSLLIAADRAAAPPMDRGPPGAGGGPPPGFGPPRRGLRGPPPPGFGPGPGTAREWSNGSLIPGAGARE